MFCPLCKRRMIEDLYNDRHVYECFHCDIMVPKNLYQEIDYFWYDEYEEEDDEI